MVTTNAIAHRFLALGGRFIIEPNGKPTFVIDADTLLSLGLTDRRRAQAMRIGRAVRGTATQRCAELTTLIRQHGHSLPGGWFVWEGR